MQKVEGNLKSMTKVTCKFHSEEFPNYLHVKNFDAKIFMENNLE